MRLILFNLMPYREIRESRLRKVFFIKAAVAVAGIGALWWGVDSEFSGRLMDKQLQMSRIKQAEVDIAKRVARVDEMRVELDQLKVKVATLKSLDQKAIWSGQILALLDSTKPQAVYLDSIKVKGDVVQITGMTTAMPTLSTWVKLLETEGNFLKGAEVKLIKAKTTDGKVDPVGIHQFDLNLNASSLPTLPAKPKEVIHAGA
ncbi:MAG: PilN domain-containing protein [Limnobacter sp.]|nr:PilN domain-containing protein [Limnobacter sp.]